MAFDSAVLSPELLLRVDGYAVYRCYSEHGDLLYIGSTGRLGKRFSSHMEKAWFLQVRGITLEWYRDEVDALNAERLAIHVEHPKYNIVHRNSTGALPPPRQRAQRKPAARNRKSAIPSPSTIRARRHRRHSKGDHSMCLLENCPAAAAPAPVASSRPERGRQPAQPSRGAVRAKRHRMHKTGDHSLCLAGNCPDAERDVVTLSPEVELVTASANGHGPAAPET